jgi:hypothetical protein
MRRISPLGLAPLALAAACQSVIDVDAPRRFDAASEGDRGLPGAAGGTGDAAGGAAPSPQRETGAGGSVPESRDAALEDLARPEADAEACPRGQPCDDGEACTFDDRCREDGCRGRPIVCEDDACMRRTCTGTRACEEVPVEAGAECVDDENGCTLDACDGRGGCVHVPRVDAPCEDDGNACTGDLCDTSGACVHPPMAGAPCADDGNECTEDRCDALGVCAHAARIDAACTDDGNDCTFDVCDAAAACVHVARPEHSACGPDGTLRCCSAECVDLFDDARHCGGCGLDCGGRDCVFFLFQGAACRCATNAQCRANGPDWTCYQGICNCQSNADCREDLGQTCSDQPGTNFCVF